MTQDAVLAINAGSSSLKFALFSGDLQALSHGEIEGVGGEPHFTARDPMGAVIEEKRWRHGASHSHEDLLGGLISWVDGHLGAAGLVAIGHRVVHGGRDFINPALATDAVLSALEALTPLAPLHQPHSLAPVRALAQLRPGLPQVVCFDTAFHHTMPDVAKRFALPRDYEAEGVRRYGFHGLSYEYIARRLTVVAPELARGRVIVAHLGAGASLCAMQDGRSVETTMSFTALDGLMMGTRCGALDPGVLLYLLNQGRTAAQIEDLLYRQSGLLGVSGVSSDMRDLLASSDVRAREAVELYCYRIAQESAALAGAMGGLDGFVFTAGVGQHAAPIRAMVCERLRWLGLVPAANLLEIKDGRISAPESRVACLVMATDEEAMIARHAVETLGLGSGDQKPAKQHSLDGVENQREGDRDGQ